MDQWLIRTADNWIAGPYPKEQVRKMVLEGKLTLQDEVCPANSYWLFLHEYAEVQKALGIQIPKAASADDITETQVPLPEKKPEESKTKTGTVVQKSLFEPLLEQAKVLSEKNSGADSSSSVQEPSASENGDGSAAATTMETPNLHRAHVTGSPHSRPPMWKGLIWMMVFAGGILIWLVIRLVGNR